MNEGYILLQCKRRKQAEKIQSHTEQRMKADQMGNKSERIIDTIIIVNCLMKNIEFINQLFLKGALII